MYMCSSEFVLVSKICNRLLTFFINSYFRDLLGHPQVKLQTHPKPCSRCRSCPDCPIGGHLDPVPGPNLLEWVPTANGEIRTPCVVCSSTPEDTANISTHPSLCAIDSTSLSGLLSPVIICVVFRVLIHKALVKPRAAKQISLTRSRWVARFINLFDQLSHVLNKF